MKLYVVTADTYDGAYGAEIHICGVYTNKEQADKRKDELEKEKDYNASVDEVETDKDIDEYLGGYIE